MQISGIPALTDTYENYIWVLQQQNQAWVIDPGEAQPVMDFLKQHQLILKGILITHRHGDHVNGVSKLIEAYSNTHNRPQVFGPKKANLAFIDHPLQEGDRVELFENITLSVLNTPGHTQDHIAFYNNQHLFCGDTLFTGGCGKLLGGTSEQYADSIIKLRNLPDSLEFYCAHEYSKENFAFARLIDPENKALKTRAENFTTDYPNQIINQAPSTLGLEKTTNPFLRFDLGDIQQTLNKHQSEQLNAGQLFAKLRALKDQFDQTGSL